MVEFIYHHQKNRWQMLKQDFRDRFVGFETFNGAVIFLPWGWGFFYYGFPWNISRETFFLIVSQPQFGYNYALMSTGIVLMIWGVRKIFVNRVKQTAIFEQRVEKRMDSIVS